MKKIFSLMAAALMSVAMMAGENDLLWDYSEAQIPTSGPDRNLYYGAYVNDAPSTNLGLNGVKMNSSGYAYFTKAAVAGKLKLTFGPRKQGGKIALMVHTWAGETPAAETKIAETEVMDELQTVVIDLAAEQNNIYISRTSSSGEGVLQKIQFVEDVARSFVDFKIEFRNDPYTVLLPESGELPEGVVVAGTNYNGGQHGIYGGSITVPVDGPVKFTIGACQYSGSVINVKKDGADFATVNNNAACGETAGNFAQFVTYVYTGEAAELTFQLAGNTYIPYFFAEATDIMPCEIIFKDQNGDELSRVATYEGAKLEALPDESVLPELCDSCFFRGWFYTNNKKAKVGDIINGNTTIQAKVTPLEVATVGSVQTYDFADVTFYPEDHETVEVHGGAWHDAQHGWYFTGNESMFDNLDDVKGVINVSVAGKAVIVITACTYSENGTIEVLENGEWPGTSFEVTKNSTPDGTEFVVEYPNENPTRLTILLHNKQYIHKVVVYNVEDFMEKDETTGFYMVPPGDVASFLMALVQAQPGEKIFLPRGTYDLGETCLTTISKNNISIIGESMEQTIIKNAPDASKESIDKTATIKINKNVQNTYLQDLTIQNALDYYKNNNGRAVALWDQGTKTVCKNVRLLSYQDTYYSNLVGAVKYFEDGEIHGTVDFICGDGSVYFKNTELVCEQRSTSGGGSDALTASNADASDKGYVFESCSVRYADDIQGTLPVVSLGRSWNNKPKTVFLNTLLADNLVMTKDASAQKDKIQRWTLGAMNALPEKFGEFNSKNEAGEVVSPASNNVTFVLGTNEKQMETILNADEAATYTMDYTLGNWSATAASDAKQVRKNVSFEDGVLSWNASEEGVYLVYLHSVPYCITTETSFDVTTLGWNDIMDLYDKYGMGDMMPTAEYYVRFGNGRGGFGPAVYPGETPESIENTEVSNSQVIKTVRDGQLIIIRDNKEYNVYGLVL